MLITVSGLVGSGKSTVAKHLVRVLRAEPSTAAHWRFSRLPCFHPFRRPRRVAASRKRSGRGTGHRLKPLTASATLGYIVRILAFRIYLLRQRSTTHKVVNRYFYDNLAHFTLDGARERMYLSLLARLIPRPDVAILVMASIDTTRVRRPSFAEEYLTTLHGSYTALGRTFPNLVTVVTDAGAPSLELAETAVRERGQGADRQPPKGF